MRKSYVRKYLAVAVILSLTGVAFAPSINANISKEMVEFTTEVCGIDNSNINQKNVVTLNRPDRTFIIGKIKDLLIEDNHYSFLPVNILMIYIHITSHAQFIWISHIKEQGSKLGINDVKFRGILKPNFICGIFYRIDTYEIYGERI